MAAIFLNVDLEIESPHPLDEICAEFSAAETSNLFHGRTKGGYLATFECSPGGPASDPDSIIQTFCNLIERFDQPAKELWASAYRRTFDLGYEADGSEASGSFRSELNRQTIQRIASLEASVVLTFYPPSPDEPTTSNVASPGSSGH